ncbi:class I lanthipeptide [Dokdonia sp.]|uniref:class I lanthipeptide n=1 Tax=Dokdonia sp. TaxID=2024995 RepID=UPI0032655790
MKRLNESSGLSLKRMKIARLNNTQMKQVSGGNQANISSEEIIRSSWRCLFTIIADTVNTSGD